MFALNRGNNNRALFETSSPMKIQRTPLSGLGKLTTLNEYSSGLPYFT